MNKKLIWGVVIAVIIIGGGIAYSFLNQKFDCCDGSQQRKAMETRTADWKTYTNMMLGYEFKYPKEFLVSDKSKDYVNLLNPKYPGKDGTDVPYEYLRIQISKSDCVPYDWTRGGSSGGDVTDSYKTTCFAGNKKLSVEAFAMGDSSKAIYDEILSTFKFTSPTTTQSKIETNQEILSKLVTDWKKIGQNIIPGFPDPKNAFYGYPTIIQFIGNNHIVLSYQDNYNPLFAVISYDQSQFTYLDGLRSSPFKVDQKLWNAWRSKYGDVAKSPITYEFSSSRTGDTVYPSDWKMISTNPFAVATYSNTSPSIKIISPNGGQTLKIGDKQTITFKTTGSIKPEHRISLVLEPGYIPLVILSATSTSYEWTVPQNVCYGGDACGSLNPGTYKITASLYDNQPCVGYCIPTGAKLLSEDKSDTYFTITN